MNARTCVCVWCLCVCVRARACALWPQRAVKDVCHALPHHPTGTCQHTGDDDKSRQNYDTTIHGMLQSTGIRPTINGEHYMKHTAPTHSHNQLTNLFEQKSQRFNQKIKVPRPKLQKRSFLNTKTDATRGRWAGVARRRGGTPKETGGACRFPTAPHCDLPDPFLAASVQQP